MYTRIVLVVLAALLALPMTQLASPVEAKNRSRTITRAFANPTEIGMSLSDDYVASADPYPSAVVVAGLKGTIRDVNLTLNGLTHGEPYEVAVLLVGPRGQTAIVMAEVGGSTDIADVTLRLDDEAAAELPEAAKLQSGAFRPTNVTGKPFEFNAPAPLPSANTALSVFDGGNPNGTWRLFVNDEQGYLYPGAFEGGWELEITTKVKAKKKKR